MDAVRARDLNKAAAAAAAAGGAGGAGGAGPSVEELRSKYASMATFKLRVECKRHALAQDGSADAMRERLVEALSPS